jgi:alkaline phosphatase D
MAQVNNTATFKFVASSVPFTTLWSHDAQIDSWAGFLRERQQLLEAFHSVPNVFVLSGDRHEFAAILFNGKTSDSYPVYEFSTSPLSMFYMPFIRTLAPRSQDNVTRTRIETLITENNTAVVEFIEQLPKEEVLKYLPIGNFKWYVYRRFWLIFNCEPFD